MKIVNNTTLDVIGDHTPAFSVGINYHSRRHIDEDMYFTVGNSDCTINQSRRQNHLLFHISHYQNNEWWTGTDGTESNPIPKQAAASI